MYEVKTVSIQQGEGTSILIFSDNIQKLCIDCMSGGNILIRTPSGKMYEKIIPIDYDHVKVEINNTNIKKLTAEV